MMTKIRRRVLPLFVGVATLSLTGCLSQEGATCPLPHDGVCAPIHVVDATWQKRPAKAERIISDKGIEPQEGDTA